MTTTPKYARRRWIALSLLCFAQFIVVLDASIVNVALPSIGMGLSFSQETLSWVPNAYVLTFGGFLLLGGRLADLLDRRRVFLGGLVLVAVASLAAGFAVSEGQLIAARAAQGVGAAIIAPAALSILNTTFSDGAERNKALGAWGAVGGAAGATGALLGGVLTQSIGWRWVLWVNVPIAAIVAALTPAVIAENRSQSKARRFDFLGAASVTAGLSVLAYSIVDAADAGWGSEQTLGLIGAAAVLLAAFVVIELRSDAPLVPFGIFRLRTLSGANAVGLLLGASLLSMFFFSTLYMQQVLAFSAIETGLAYLPLALTVFVVAAIASRLVTRFGFKPVLIVGLSMIGTAQFWFSFVSADGAFGADLLGPLVLAGAGVGLAMVPDTVAAMTGVRPEASGLASGLINTSQQLGGALGLAVLATIANSRTDQVLRAAGDSGSRPRALTEGFQAAFLGGAVLAALGIVLTLMLIRCRDSRAHKRLGTGTA